MAKFKVRVNVIAELSYEVEVDEADEPKANDAATAMWASKMPSDFQVHKDYVTDWETETEQLTAVCPGCGVEHVILHNDLRVCHCGQFGHNLDLIGPRPSKMQRLRPHLIVDNVCTPEPWWWDDSDYCAACGAKIEAEEKTRNV